MNERMTKERWDALFGALSRGIDQIEDELDHDMSNDDPDNFDSYGARQLELERARQAFRILYRRHGA